ncbi:hypothetical protein Q3G72_020784 [Acer saccharum]|nr:hypothetical protein Q3G72_020784 [Acer saccharum]
MRNTGTSGVQIFSVLVQSYPYISFVYEVYGSDPFLGVYRVELELSVQLVGRKLNFVFPFDARINLQFRYWVTCIDSFTYVCTLYTVFKVSYCSTVRVVILVILYN